MASEQTISRLKKKVPMDQETMKVIQQEKQHIVTIQTCSNYQQVQDVQLKHYAAIVPSDNFIKLDDERKAKQKAASQ